MRGLVGRCDVRAPVALSGGRRCLGAGCGGGGLVLVGAGEEVEVGGVVRELGGADVLVLVDEEVKGQSYLTTTTGQGKLVAVSLDLRMDQASRQSLASQANKNAASIAEISVLGPVALGILGLILLLTATTPWRYLRRPGHDDQDEDTRPAEPPHHPSNFDLLPGPDQD